MFISLTGEFSNSSVKVFWVCFREKFVHLFVTGTVESLLSYKELEKENSCMKVREKDDKISVQSLERWLCDLQIKLLFSPTDKTEPLMKAKLGRFP